MTVILQHTLLPCLCFSASLQTDLRLQTQSLNCFFLMVSVCDLWRAAIRPRGIEPMSKCKQRKRQSKVKKKNLTVPGMDIYGSRLLNRSSIRSSRCQRLTNSL
ncbi:hypothetical protein PAMP_006815 [Pampus punctatissimus]